MTPCLCYTSSGLPLNGARPYMSKWEYGKYKALLLTIDILRSIEAFSSSGVPSSKAACIFDAICLGLQICYRCSEYYCGNPTSKSNK